MEAEIDPLDGKYYGTKVNITTETKGEAGFLKLWRTIPGYTPSDRELERRGVTREEYNNNEVVGEYPAGVISEEAEPMRAREIICDDHFESQPDYKLAKYLVSAINNAEVCQHCGHFFNSKVGFCDCLQDVEEEKVDA